MDGQKYSLKDVFRLRIRICLLLVLVVFILGFLFSPKVEMKVETKEPEEDTVHFYPYESEEFENIAELPDNDVDDVISEEEYGEEEEVEDIDLDKKDLPFNNDKDADVKFGTPVYIPHSVKPKPLNLDEVKFEYPKSMRMLGVSGKVHLQLFIDKEGNVRNVVQMDSLHPVLDKVAVENAWKIKFSPAEQRDKPVAVWYAFWVEFKLE